jgi:hypothetical protein
MARRLPSWIWKSNYGLYRFCFKWFDNLGDATKSVIAKVHHGAGVKSRDDMTHEQLVNILLMKREMTGINFEEAFKVSELNVSGLGRLTGRFQKRFCSRLLE